MNANEVIEIVHGFMSLGAEIVKLWNARGMKVAEARANLAKLRALYLADVAAVDAGLREPGDGE